MKIDSIKTVSMSLVAEEMTQPHINFHSRILFCNKTPNDIIRLRYADADIVLAAMNKRAPGKERISGVANDRLDTEIKMAACFLRKTCRIFRITRGTASIQ